MNKIVKIVLIVVGLLSVVLWFSLPADNDPNAVNSSSMHWMFIIMYVLLAVAIALSLFFALGKLISTPGSLKKALFSLGGLAVVVGISYALSSNNAVVVDEMAKVGITTTESVVKNVGMGLNVFAILTVIAVALMLWPSVKKLFVK